jgi:hypothetical protein
MKTFYRLFDGGEQRLAALRSAAPAEGSEPTFGNRISAAVQKPKRDPAQRDDEFDELVAVGMRRTAGVALRRDAEPDPAELFYQ